MEETYKNLLILEWSDRKSTTQSNNCIPKLTKIKEGLNISPVFWKTLKKVSMSFVISNRIFKKLIFVTFKTDYYNCKNTLIH